MGGVAPRLARAQGEVFGGTVTGNVEYSVNGLPPGGDVCLRGQGLLSGEVPFLLPKLLDLA